MKPEVFDRVLGEAQDIGINFFIILGGEPFVYPELLPIIKKHNKSCFQIYTNGSFIDKDMARRLVELGNEVTCFVRYNSRNDPGLIELLPPSVRKEIRVVPGDLRDAEAIYSVIESKDVVFHLGALIAIPYSYVHPRETIETNVIGTMNVMTAARDSGAERIVHTSTSEVYGTAHYVPMDENHPLQGQSPYSASKIGADMIAESFGRSFDLPVATIRPFNFFGPRQSARAVIPTIISRSMRVDYLVASFFGGTSFLIVVGVALDTVQQIESHLLMRHYDGFMKKGRIRARRF